MTDRILIVDFGSQVTQLIARRVREAGVYCEIHPFHKVDAAFLADFGARGDHPVRRPGLGDGCRRAARDPARLRGSACRCSASATASRRWCAQLGGRSKGGTHREFGRASVEVTDDCALFDGVWRKGRSAPVWMSHGDRVTALPPGFRAVAVSEGAPFAAIADDARRFYGVQFHPEVVHTPDGARLLAELRAQGGRLPRRLDDGRLPRPGDRAYPRPGRATSASSAGCRAASIPRSPPSCCTRRSATRSLCIFVDTGLLRLGEADEVVQLFRDHYNIPLVHRDASELSSAGSPASTDPEAKRKIIGAAFIDVFEEEANKIGGADFLAQGTLYPDVIESVAFARRPAGDDQVAPQRRRPAGADEHGAGRTLARAVQGRGAGAGPRTWPAGDA